MENLSQMLQQFNNTATYIGGIIIYVISVVGMWKLFTKAGEPGWTSIIPIVNLYKICKIATGKGLLFLLLCIPGVNVIFYIILNVKLAKAYGKGGGFAVGLIFLNTLFMLILGLGSAQYVGPNGEK